jgi:hypothetical protein
MRVSSAYPFLTAVSRGVPVVLIGHTWNNALMNPQSGLSVIAWDAGVPPAISPAQGRRSASRGAGRAVSRVCQPGRFVDGGRDARKHRTLGHGHRANKDADVIAARKPAQCGTNQGPGLGKVIYGGCKSCYDAGTLVRRSPRLPTRPRRSNSSSLAMRKGRRGPREPRQAAKISTRWIRAWTRKRCACAEGLPLDVRLSKNTLDGFRRAHPLLVAQKRIPAAFDPAPASTIGLSRRRWQIRPPSDLKKSRRHSASQVRGA